MNLNTAAIEKWIFRLADETQRIKPKIWILSFLVYFGVSLFLLHLRSINDFLLEHLGVLLSFNPDVLLFPLLLAFVQLLSVLVVFALIWYLFSWPFKLFSSTFSPEEIPGLQMPVLRYQNLFEALASWLKQEVLRTSIKILIIFSFLIISFTDLFCAVERFNVRSAFCGLAEDTSYLRYLYYSLVILPTVGFGDVYPEENHIWAHATTILEILTAVIYILLSLTMIIPCLFTRYSLLSDYFQKSIETNPEEQAC